MAEILIQQSFSVPGSKVWEVLRDFGGISSWMPGLAGCETKGEGIGAVRTIEMGSSIIRERCEALDDDERSLSYSIIEGPLPVEDYIAIIDVVVYRSKWRKIIKVDIIVATHRNICWTINDGRNFILNRHFNHTCVSIT